MNKNILCYDLALCPDGLPIETVWDLYEKRGLVLYDSLNGSSRNIRGVSKMIKPPYMIGVESESNPEKILVDISTEEGAKIYKEILLKDRIDG